MGTGQLKSGGVNAENSSRLPARVMDMIVAGGTIDSLDYTPFTIHLFHSFVADNIPTIEDI